jgi:hypothetical protein
LNYVSCSPFRVPIARLAAARAAIKEEMEGGSKSDKKDKKDKKEKDKDFSRRIKIGKKKIVIKF